MRQLVRVSRADFKKRRAFYLILRLICALSFAYAAQGAVSSRGHHTVDVLSAKNDLHRGNT